MEKENTFEKNSPNEQNLDVEKNVNNIDEKTSLNNEEKMQEIENKIENASESKLDNVNVQKENDADVNSNVSEKNNVEDSTTDDENNNAENESLKEDINMSKDKEENVSSEDKDAENTDTDSASVDDTIVENEETNNEEKNKISKKSSIVFHIIAIICIALFGAAIAPKTLQNDTYYTITIGEYIYNNGISDLTKDIYSWHELPYTYPHWLYDLGMYMVYSNCGQDHNLQVDNTAGHKRIYASTMMLSATLGISIYALSYKKSKNKVVSLVVTLGALYLIKAFIAARAQLVTFILFVWGVFFIEKFLEKPKLRYAAILVLIPLLITNLHCAVFPFYFVLFMPYIGEYVLVALEDLNIFINLKLLFFKALKRLYKSEQNKAKVESKIESIKLFRADRKRKIKKLRENPYKIVVTKNHVAILLLAIMAISVLTGFLNPAGDGAFMYLYKIMKGNTTASINEHLPLTLIENSEFSVTVVIFLLVLIFTDTKIKLSDLFWLGGITYLSFKSRRQVSMFAIFCGPILAVLISNMVNKYDKATFVKIERFVSGWFGATVVICLCTIWTTNIIKPTLSNDYIDTSSYPVEASDWILKNLDISKLKLYNEYNYGSYLLYRGIPVFIDSRCDLYSPEFNGDFDWKTGTTENGRDIFSDALNIAGLAENYREKFKEYGVTHAILYQNNKLAMILEDDPNYKRIYYEGNFKIFERLDANENENSENASIENVTEEINENAEVK